MQSNIIMQLVKIFFLTLTIVWALVALVHVAIVGCLVFGALAYTGLIDGGKAIGAGLIAMGVAGLAGIAILWWDELRQR